MLFALCLIASLASATAEDPKLDGPLHIDRELVGKYEVTLTESISGFSSAPEKWVVNVTQPPTYDAQIVRDAYFYVPSDPQARTIKAKEKSYLAQSYLSVSFANPAPKPVTVQAVFDMSVYKRKLAEGAPPEKPLLPNSQKLAYTSAHPWLDMTNEDFKNWAEEEKLLIGEKETNLKYAWRIFKYIAEHFTYDEDAVGLTPIATVNAKKSNTLGLANLYLAILRAQQIPSRFVICRPLGEFKDQTTYVMDPKMDEETTHVLVEFWIDEIGWVPADIVQAAGFHEPSDFFGKTQGDMIAFHYDMYQFETAKYSFMERMDWMQNNVENRLEKAKIKRKLELKKL